MKKSKLLIPALSVASVGAVVAPMMTLTSCSKVVVSTNDVDFKGTQHAAVTGGWTIDDANQDYRKDSKHLAEDTVAALAYQAKSDMEDTKDDDVKNVKISSFSASISDFTVSEKNAKVDYDLLPNKGEIKGQLTSAKVRATYTITYDDVLDEEGKKIYKSIHNEDAYEITYDIKECFAFIGLNLVPNGDGAFENHFTLNLYGSKNASENWVLKKDYKKVTTSTATLKDDSTITNTEVDTEYHETHNAKLGSDKPIEDLGSEFKRISYLPSSYLSKVTWKTETMSMGYREDLSLPTIGLTPGYFASPIMLTPGQEYTFSADITSEDKINFFAVIDGSQGVLTKLKAKPTFKLDATEQSDWEDTDPSTPGLQSFIKDAASAAGHLTVTLKLDDSETDPIMAIPFFIHYGA